jgi:hypothetical protein
MISCEGILQCASDELDRHYYCCLAGTVTAFGWELDFLVEMLNCL